MNNKLLDTLKLEKPLPIIGVLNAFVALIAKDEGFKALYLSGASLSSGQFGIPDTGELQLKDLAEEVRRIKNVCDLPLLVDIDTGFKDITPLIESGADAVQIEDQIERKKCGHLPGKQLIPQDEMAKKVADLKKTGIAVVARTDALAVEGLEKSLERAHAYMEAGADILFLEAVETLEQIEPFKKFPLLINLTEFGKTPLWSRDEMSDIDAILYPMTLSRVMYKKAQDILKEIKSKGSQKHLLDQMMTRKELYRLLSYEEES